MMFRTKISIILLLLCELSACKSTDSRTMDSDSPIWTSPEFMVKRYLFVVDVDRESDTVTDAETSAWQEKITLKWNSGGTCQSIAKQLNLEMNNSPRKYLPRFAFLLEIRASCQEAVDALTSHWKEKGFEISPTDERADRPRNIKVDSLFSKLPSGLNPDLKKKINAVGMVWNTAIINPITNTGNDMPPCTGFHIGDRKVVTAGHCFVHDDCSQIEVKWGVFYGEAEPSLVSHCTRVILRSYEAWEADYAVIEVDQAPEEKWTFVPDYSGETTSKIALLGHPRGRQLEFSGPCDIDQTTPTSLRFNAARCPTQGGNSGGPIFRLDTLEVIGILIGGGFGQIIPDVGP